MTAEVVDIFQMPAKIALANNAGKGWPDVVFNGANLIAMTATERNDWAMDLAPYVSQDLLDQFEPSVIAECIRPDGRLICLSNDIAQSVTYYNKPLMDEFGYSGADHLGGACRAWREGGRGAPGLPDRGLR